eukprot:TRINITY_DN67993_c1_g7_i8.p1 TRINITY_DN67993_c1_g7~~TRINITY_DN67993_c1_g7_i8.p1  ORF type:complete len:130 (+),score=5.38 TRINITY_DN67993_c1_g7_i8:557-946(+)
MWMRDPSSSSDYNTVQKLKDPVGSTTTKYLPPVRISTVANICHHQGRMLQNVLLLGLTILHHKSPRCSIGSPWILAPWFREGCTSCKQVRPLITLTRTAKEGSGILLGLFQPAAAGQCHVIQMAAHQRL